MRFFAQARDAAGCREAEIEGDTLAAVLAAAVSTYGRGLEEVIATSTVWVNGERAEPSQEVRPSDEVAVLPPVSGG